MSTPVIARPMIPDRRSIDTTVSPTIAVRSAAFSFWYGQKQVLHGVDLSLHHREITAIIGPSGCGKSTFLRAINRMHDLVPNARHDGDILLGDRSVYAPGTDIVALRRRIGMVFQKPSPFPLSVFDNVAWGPRLNGTVSRRDLPDLVEKLLRQTGLWDEVSDRLDSSALALSGGQQQRLCIARALGNAPEIILLDEPCSALDPIATQKIEELLFELKQEYTIVIVTHNLQQAARLSDRTAFFELGQVVEYDRTGQLFTNPAQERTEAYITGRFG